MSAVQKLRQQASKADERAIRAAFELAMQHLARVDDQVFAHMRQSGNPDIVEQILPLTLDVLRPFVDGLTQSLQAEARRIALAVHADAHASTRKARPVGDGTYVEIGKVKRKKRDENPFAAREFDLGDVRKVVAKLVVDIGREQRRSLKKIIARRFDPDSKANDTLVKDIRATVGLTEREAGAVMNLRDDLDGRGIGAKRVDQQVEAYAKKLLKKRAERIARTETVRVETMGRRAGWHEAQKDGLLSKKARVEWILSSGACDICRDIAKQKPLLNGGSFQGPEGPIHGPPAHPHCLCDVVASDTGE